MAKVKGAITVNIERCKGCNLCAVACPTNTLALQPNEVNDRGYHYAYMANPDNCTGCCSGLPGRLHRGVPREGGLNRIRIYSKNQIF